MGIEHHASHSCIFLTHPPVNVSKTNSSYSQLYVSSPAVKSMSEEIYLKWNLWSFHSQWMNERIVANQLLKVLTNSLNYCSRSWNTRWMIFLFHWLTAVTKRALSLRQRHSRDVEQQKCVVRLLVSAIWIEIILIGSVGEVGSIVSQVSVDCMLCESTT